MKRLYTILAALLLSVTALYAQSWHWNMGLSLQKEDGTHMSLNEDPDRILRIDIDHEKRTFTVVTDQSYYSDQGEYIEKTEEKTYPISQLGQLNFSYDGVRWNLPYKESDAISHYMFGYPALMIIRDRLSQDMLAPNTGYDWFRTWSQITNLGSRYQTADYVSGYLTDLIADANLIIRSIDADNTDPNLKGVLGVAYASRALIYLDYARMFEFLPSDWNGGLSLNDNGSDVAGLTVPIITEDIQTASRYSNLYEVPRATKQEMVRFILSDLDKAEALIAFNQEASRTLPHLDAVYGLKARLHLWNEDYAQAREYARRAIDAAQQAGIRPMTAEQMLSTTQGFNDLNCWMWGIQYTKDFGNLANWSSWMANEASFGYSRYVTEAINPLLYVQIGDTDIRKRLWKAPEGTALSGQTPFIDQTVGEGLQPLTSVKFRPAQGELYNYLIAAATAVPLMRVEEMYLIEAEAAARLNPQEGITLLTTFMQTWRDPSYTYSADKWANYPDPLLYEIILQKRIELWGEGQAYFDLKRTNLPVTHYYTGNYHNTRPPYFNLVFGQSLENSNLGLKGNNNPDISSLYSSNTLPADSLEQMLSQTFLLETPAFTRLIDVLPLDSVYLIYFGHDPIEDQTQQLNINYSFEISLNETFAPKSSFSMTGTGNGNYLSANNLNNEIVSRLSQAGQPVAGEYPIYLRCVATPEANKSFHRYSNTISLKVRTFDYYEQVATNGIGYSLAPKFEVTLADSLIDMTALADETYFHMLNIRFENQTASLYNHINPLLRIDTEPSGSDDLFYVYNHPMTSFVYLDSSNRPMAYLDDLRQILGSLLDQYPGTVTFDYVQVGQLYTEQNGLVFRNEIIDLPALGFITDPAWYQTDEWQYLSGEDGSPLTVTFKSVWWDEVHTTFLKYKEENGIRYCRTDNGLLPVDTTQASRGRGPWGTDIDFEFTWRLSDNAIDIPAQYFGQNYQEWENTPVPNDSLAIYVYDYYSLYQALGMINPDSIADADAFYEAKPNLGRSFYDDNGHFYFMTKYYIADGRGGWTNYTNDLQGLVEGYSDYSSSVSLNGSYSRIDALRDVQSFDVQLGSDCAIGRLAVVSGRVDTDQALGCYYANHDAQNHEMSYTDLFENGHYECTMENRPAGDYTAVLYCFDEAGEIVYVAWRYFSWQPANTEPWQDIALGDYTFSAFFGGTDKDMTVAVRGDYYRVREWNGNYDLVFFYDEQQTPQIVVPVQSTGYYHPTYGEVFVRSTNADTLHSYVETDPTTGLPVFHLLMQYYVNAGSFPAGYETLKITRLLGAPDDSTTVQPHGETLVNFLGFEANDNQEDYAHVHVVLGENIDYARIAVYQGSTDSTAVSQTMAGIIGGSYASMLDVRANGDFFIPMSAMSTTASAQILAYLYSNGQIVGVEPVGVYTYDKSSLWQDRYIGTYFYDVLYPGMVGNELVLSTQRNENGVRYRINGLPSGPEFKFTLYEYNTLIVDDNQYTWMGDSTTGDFLVGDALYHQLANTTGHYVPDSGLFYFNVVYYVSQGIVAYGQERFLIRQVLDEATAGAKAQSEIQSLRFEQGGTVGRQNQTGLQAKAPALAQARTLQSAARPVRPSARPVRSLSELSLTPVAQPGKRLPAPTAVLRPTRLK